MRYRDAHGKRYVMAKDFVIPEGTEVAVAPNRVARAVPFASAVVGPTNDTTAELTMPLDEAIELGLIREAE